MLFRSVSQSRYLGRYSIRVYDEVIPNTYAIMDSSVNIKFASGTNYSSAINAVKAQANGGYFALLYNAGGDLIGTKAVVLGSYSGGNQNIGIETFAAWADVAEFRLVSYYYKEEEYNYCVSFPKVELMANPDCFRSQMTIWDNTKYPTGYTVTSREMVVHYPLNASGDPVANSVTTQNASITIGPNIWSGGYNVQSTVVVSYTGEDGLVVEQTYKGAIFPNVQCDPGLCCVNDCLSSVHNRYKEALANGGASQVSVWKEVLFQANIYISRYYLYMLCNQPENAIDVASELVSFLRSCGCNCDCNPCGTNEEPVEIQPFGIA